MAKPGLRVSAGVALVLLLSGCPGNGDSGSLHAASTSKTVLSAPPWTRPQDTVEAIKAAGMSLQTDEGMKHHIHARLDVYYEGNRVKVPADIGLVVGQGFSQVHTRDDSGTLHVEAPQKGNYTLGQFFTAWDVPLVDVTVTVNGEPVPDPASLVIDDQQTIVVRFKEPAADETASST